MIPYIIFIIYIYIYIYIDSYWFIHVYSFMFRGFVNLSPGVGRPREIPRYDFAWLKESGISASSCDSTGSFEVPNQHFLQVTSWNLRPTGRYEGCWLGYAFGCPKVVQVSVKMAL